VISNREEIKIALKENQEVAIQRIDDTLKEWGWTRKVLAERAGIKENTLYNIFGGSNKLGISVFQSIAQALVFQSIIYWAAQITRMKALNMTLYSTVEYQKQGRQKEKTLHMAQKAQQSRKFNRSLPSSALKTSKKPPISLSGFIATARRALAIARLNRAANKLRGIGTDTEEIYFEIATRHPVAAQIALPRVPANWLMRRSDGTIQAIVIGGIH